MGAYINKACGRVRGACFHRTRGGGRSIGHAVVFFHAPFGPSTQKLRTFSHTKIIIRSTCAHCARKKRAAVCIISSLFGRVVFFLFYCTHCVQNASSWALLSRATARKFGQRRANSAQLCGRTTALDMTARRCFALNRLFCARRIKRKFALPNKYTPNTAHKPKLFTIFAKENYSTDYSVRRVGLISSSKKQYYGRFTHYLRHPCRHRATHRFVSLRAHRQRPAFFAQRV